MRIRIIPVTPFQQNCTLLICDKTKKAAVVDPGGDVAKILAAITEEQVAVEKIFITHAHLDHAGGTQELAQTLKVPIEGPHQDDIFWLEGFPMQSQMFGFPPVEQFTPDRWLKQDDKVNFGEVELEVLHCPGHTPGHVVFIDHQSNQALVGDVLFRGSIGRTDFPMGNHDQLITAIKTKLWPLPDDMEFVSGHGPKSTFGKEKKTNPFIF
ncbi:MULTISPECIES: MBL fold metallo-hydrolase [unclassified Motilimonas]|uniref:MBL fold metallo-hydrolase n=1 Tax=Motilimonas TaxID=1914248 RepID=UPI001E3A6AC9|nr:MULTISPECIES: MBL fold metallo-hydrolase [unclassified Motilimonas]MCE0558146.1 MBL fold metallo-hydrolase [Motilimonas sp. E26]MDO6524505.1 MBL fold metallo-hydrolase [Motilimonas sp. 1_MG-2023]